MWRINLINPVTGGHGQGTGGTERTSVVYAHDLRNAVARTPTDYTLFPASNYYSRSSYTLPPPPSTVLCGIAKKILIADHQRTIH